jgi:hypothetical protein
MTSAATRATARGDTVHFGLIELDLLTTHAGVPLPFPLHVPSFGRIPAERDVLLATAGQTLRMRGLADDEGPVGAAAELVAALREYRGTVDLVLADADGAFNVVALFYRHWALVFFQPRGDDPAGRVLVRRTTENAVESELLGMVRDVAAAALLPIMLPTLALHAAQRLIGDVEADDADEQRHCLRELAHDYGSEPTVFDQLADLLPVVTGWGQLGASRRASDEQTRAGTELSWLDSPRGRVTVNHAANGWVSINPLRPSALRLALENLATIARGPRQPNFATTRAENAGPMGSTVIAQ